MQGEICLVKQILTLAESESALSDRLTLGVYRLGSNMTFWAAVSLLIPLFGSSICQAIGVKTYGMICVLSVWILHLVTHDWERISISSIAKARHWQISVEDGVAATTHIVHVNFLRGQSLL